MKVTIAFLLACCIQVSAQMTIHPGSTNTAAVVLKPSANNLMTLSAVTSRNDSNGFVLLVGADLPVVSGIMASNTWSLYDATNGMHAGDFRVVNSNGVAQTSVWSSNGVPVLKQIAP